VATSADTRDTIEAVWRIEAPRLIGGLCRLVRDVGLAEELAQDALVAALEQWPASGIPDNPAAWLMATAKHRAVDQLRHGAMKDDKHRTLAVQLAQEERRAPDIEGALDDARADVGDDLLRLMFVACHPLVPREAQVALTLRLLGGLSTEEIARAFLLPEPTVAQRIVRAKRTLGQARVPFEVPRGEDRAARLTAVLGVIYLIFNEGHAATRGDDLMRPALCVDAMRLGRVLAELMPEAPEAMALCALMELTHARSAARTATDGTPILLLDQDRRRWDRLLIRRGLEALARAASLGGSAGPYALQAAIAACHARAATAIETDWVQIASLYAALGMVTPSPVIELNRAMAVAMAHGAAEGLAIADAVAHEPALAGYHLLPSVRGDLLARLGRNAEAKKELERAAELTQNTRERALLLARAAALPTGQAR
jgi:RNA polymerase sigma factor (sigma-70 family)